MASSIGRRTTKKTVSKSLCWYALSPFRRHPKWKFLSCCQFRSWLSSIMRHDDDSVRCECNRKTMGSTASRRKIGGRRVLRSRRLGKTPAEHEARSHDGSVSLVDSKMFFLSQWRNHFFIQLYSNWRQPMFVFSWFFFLFVVGLVWTVPGAIRCWQSINQYVGCRQIVSERMSYPKCKSVLSISSVCHCTKWCRTHSRGLSRCTMEP